MVYNKIFYFRRLKVKKTGILLIALTLLCASAFAQAVTLDDAIEGAARYIEERLAAGTKVAVLNFSSSSERFSDYVVEELAIALVNGDKMVIVDMRDFALIKSEMNLQQTGDVDDKSAQAIGKRLGAQSIVSGSLVDTGALFRFRVNVISGENAVRQGAYSKNIDATDTQVAFLLSGKRPASTRPAQQAAVQAQTPAASAPVQTPAPVVPAPVVAAAPVPAVVTPVREPGSHPEDFVELTERGIAKPGRTVASLAFDRTGVGIFTGYHGEWGEILDAQSGARLKALPAGGILVPSPEGNLLAAVSVDDDTKIRIFDTETGAYREGDVGQAVQVLAYSPNGEEIFAADQETLTRWDANSGIKYSGGTVKASIVTLEYSPDGKYLAGGFSYREGETLLSVLSIWGVESGERINRIEVNSNAGVKCLTWSPDSKYIASSFDDNKVKIHNMETGAEVWMFTGHTGQVNAVVYSPDGKRVISASDDKTIKVWDTVTGHELKTLTGHTDGVKCLAWSPDGGYFISGSDDGTIKFWGLR
jgi:TolB-like protein